MHGDFELQTKQRKQNETKIKRFRRDKSQDRVQHHGNLKVFYSTKLGLALRLLRALRACFSKVPKLFGRISGDIILFVSLKRRRLEARNFAVIFIFIPFTTCEKISFTE